MAEIQLLEAALRRSVSGEVRFDAGSKAAYASDASNYRQVPIAVVLPRSAEDIAAAVAACREHAPPILPPGGGPSPPRQGANPPVPTHSSNYPPPLPPI